jgi:hypothetical protein
MISTGKVINFTVSKSKTRPTWTAWLDDWKYSAGATIQVDNDADDDEKEEQFRLPEDDDDDQPSSGPQLEKLPQYPVKKFG